MTFALLCTGQGHQNADMFRLTAEVPQAQPLFDCATQLLGADPREPDFWQDANRSFTNRAAQVLCTLQGLAAQAAMATHLPPRRCVAGYSVGELAAWGVAGVIAPLDVLELAAKRADRMDAARGNSVHSMVSIRGLSENQMASLCAGKQAAIAIANPNLSWVVAGAAPDTAKIAAEAQAAGAAHITEIPVAVASHTFLMTSAAQAFGADLAQSRMTKRMPAGVRLLSGIDGRTVFDSTEGAQKLAAQVSQTVRWDACLQALVEAGVTICLELGPGRALASTLTSAYGSMEARSVDDFATLQGVLEWVDKRVA